MRLHGNARTTPYARELMVRRVLERAEPVKDTAEAFAVSTRTAYKWLARYRRHGLDGLQDRSSRPRRSPSQTPPRTARHIARLRRQRMTAWEISQKLSIPRSTGSRCLAQQGWDA